MSYLSSTQRVIYSDSRSLAELPENSVDLVVTSPPYPMIEMWDLLFSTMNPEIEDKVNQSEGTIAFELMHLELDKIWDEVDRVTKEGAILCINIGDATRSIGKKFQLFSNHARILNYFLNKNYHNLPNILWRKQTNAPNKFMGSGMLPVGAYVTLEHEYIIILRKHSKREFKTEEEKTIRKQSGFFWEERNVWFSDIWEDIKGTKQKLLNNSTRERSAAFPYELAYRLVNMFSVKGDTVFDPFFGTGTTSVACASSGRNCIGVEIDQKFQSIISETILTSRDFINNLIGERLKKHTDFVKLRLSEEKVLKHYNNFHDFPVMTSQEKEIQLLFVDKIIQESENQFRVFYSEIPTESKPIFASGMRRTRSGRYDRSEAESIAARSSMIVEDLCVRR